MSQPEDTIVSAGCPLGRTECNWSNKSITIMHCKQMQSCSSRFHLFTYTRCIILPWSKYIVSWQHVVVKWKSLPACILNQQVSEINVDVERLKITGQISYLYTCYRSSDVTDKEGGYWIKSTSHWWKFTAWISRYQ